MSAERKRSHCELLLELLSDGAWHNHHELYELRIVGHSRVAELRDPARYGYSIEHTRRGSGAEQEHLYRLVGVPADPPPLAVRLEQRLPEHVQYRLNSLFRSRAALASSDEELRGIGADVPLTAEAQLDLDELVGVENELSALRSMGVLTDGELDRFDQLEARHQELEAARARIAGSAA